MVEYRKAKKCEYEEVTQEANLIFTVGSDGDYDHRYFQDLLPKLFGDDSVIDQNLIAVEDGKILALVGGFKNEATVMGHKLPVTGIGNVGVDPSFRRQGFMKKVMALIDEECRADGTVMSMLGGQRQRYEHYGYTHANNGISFSMDMGNLYRIFGDVNFGHTFRDVKADDDELLDKIYEDCERRKAKALRPRDTIYKILCSWHHIPVAIFDKNGDYAGFLVCGSGRGTIFEMELRGDAGYAQVAFDYSKSIGNKDLGFDNVGFEEVNKIKELEPIGCYQLGMGEMFKIYDYRKMLQAYFDLAASYKKLADGKCSFEIIGFEKVLVTVENNKATVESFEGDADIVLPDLVAIRFFFSSAKNCTNYGFDVPPFVDQWFPLPLSWRSEDNV